MKLLVVNPNTTASMTQAAVAQVRALAGADVQVMGVTATFGHPVIASWVSFVVGAHAALSASAGAAQDFDGMLLACFGDPGLAALQATSAVPVAGMAQSALREAVGAGRPYRIITAGAAWEGMLHATVRLEQAGELLERVVILQGTGLDAAADPQGFLAQIQRELDDAAKSGVPTMILGGVGFAGLRSSLNYPGILIDGLEAATRALLAAVRSRNQGAAQRAL